MPMSSDSKSKWLEESPKLSPDRVPEPRDQFATTPETESPRPVTTDLDTTYTYPYTVAACT